MSERNFEYWKEVVGLEEFNFPYLIELDEESIHLARIAPSRISEIQKAIAGNNIVAVQVRAGWGATTLFRYMANDMKSNKLNLTILFDFEKDCFYNGNLTEKRFIFQTKWKLARNVLDIMMVNSFPERYMFEVLQFEDTGEIPWKAYFRKKRQELNECMENSEIFYQKFPFYAEMDITECVDYFLRNFQIQTIFMYLFPSRADEDDILELVGIIKNIFDGKDLLPAAIREVFFITPQLFRLVSTYYTRPYMNIYYQQYSAAEIFGMLVNTYKLQDESNMTISDVFDSDLISSVYDKSLTLNGIMRRVEEKIISMLEGEKWEIPFKLTLKKMEERGMKNDYQ